MMMSKINFEEFQKSSQKDRHWELKNEFMQWYKNTINEKKLLAYLAEVYANVILEKCSYPEPLVKEIMELSKPLQLQKQLEEISGNTRVKRHIDEQEEKTSSMHEHFKRPSKQLKTSLNEVQSNPIFPSTIKPLCSAKQQFSDIFSVPLHNKGGAQIVLQLREVLKASKEQTSEQASDQMNFHTNERHFNPSVSAVSNNASSLEQFRNTFPNPLYNKQNPEILSTFEPVYKTPERSRPFKKVKFYDNEEQSSSIFFSADTDVQQPLLELFRNTHSIPFLEEQSVQNFSESNEALKRSSENSEGVVKQINFLPNERQSSSTFSSTSTDELQSPMEHFRNTISIPFLEEHVSQNLPKSETYFKNSPEHSKSSFKEMNFNANEEQSNSTFLSTSTDVLQSPLAKFSNAYAIPFLEEPDAQNLSKSKAVLEKSVEHSEILSKQMNLRVNEGQSSSNFLTSSTDELQSFEKQFHNTYAAALYNEQDAKLLSKSDQMLKAPEKLSKRFFKEINCINEEQSGSTISSDILQLSIQKFTNTCTSSSAKPAVKPVQHFVHYPDKNVIQEMNKNNVHYPNSEQTTNKIDKQNHYSKNDEQMVQFLPKSEEALEAFLDKETEPLYQIKDVFIENKKAENIISILGLPFIRQFAKYAKSCVTRISSPMKILERTCAKFKILNQWRFEVDTDPDCPVSSPLHYHKFFLKDCLIASEISMNKKKGKTLVAETGLSTLVKLGTLDRNKASQICRSTLKRKETIMNSVQLFDIFSKNVINRTKDEPAIITLKSIASLLHMEEDCVVLKVTSKIAANHAAEFTCNLFLNGILISYATDVSIQSSKNLAAEFALIKLSNLADYVIHEGKLKNILDYRKDFNSSRFSSSKANSTHTKEKHSFVLNKKLFDSSITDGIMLIQRDSVQINVQRNLRDVLLDCGNFFQKSLSFPLEEISLTHLPSYTKARIHIGTPELGAGVAFTKEEAKTIACAKAFINMRKNYYTLRVKDDHIEGFLVTRDEIINDESYSKNKIKKQYLRVKKIKRNTFKLEFPGKDIKDSIEVTATPSLSKGQKLCTETESSNRGKESSVTETKTTITDTETSSTDMQLSCINMSSESSVMFTNFKLFTKKIEIMLQKFQESEDYCDLLFSDEFTHMHRAIITIVRKLNLRHLILVAEPKTYLWVIRKYEVTKLLNFLVKNGGSNGKFELIDASKTAM